MLRVGGPLWRPLNTLTRPPDTCGPLTHTLHTHTICLSLSLKHTHTRALAHSARGGEGLTGRVKLTTVAQSSGRKWLHHTLRHVISLSLTLTETHTHTRQGVFNSARVWPGALLKPLARGLLLHQMNCPFVTGARLSFWWTRCYEYNCNWWTTPLIILMLLQ